MKTCAKCKKTKEFALFGNSAASKDGLKSYCKPCRFIEYKEIKNKNPEKYRKKQNASTKKYRKANPDRRKNIELKTFYGITLEQYNIQLLNQNGSCSICKKNPSKKRLVVDHCHKSGAVRGLLCDMCNWGLGQFRDDTGLLKEAIEYLNSKGRWTGLVP